MKKLVMKTVLAVALLVALPTHAQVKLGLKGGINVGQTSLNKEVFNISNRTGYFIGPTFKFSLPLAGFGMDISALYDHREAKIGTVKGGATLMLKQQQVVVPINLKYIIGLGCSTNIFAFAGPQLGFNVGDKEKRLKEEISEWNLKESNFSINAGVGLTLAKHFQLSANYNIVCGATGDVTIKSALDQVKDYKARTNSLQFALTYFF